MAKSYKHYLVVRDNDHQLFAAKVQAKLEDGWLCRGKMRTERTGSYNFDYLQNMVRA